MSEPVIAQLKALAKNHTKLEFETTASKEQGFMQIPWADLFDSGSYAIKESGANLMALFSSTVKQNRKLRVSFVKELKAQLISFQRKKNSYFKKVNAGLWRIPKSIQ